jgi:hypothetical protein
MVSAVTLQQITLHRYIRRANAIANGHTHFGKRVQYQRRASVVGKFNARASSDRRR